MNNELLIAKGKLSDLQQQYEQMEMKAESMLIQLRELLNPFSEFLDLELDKILLMVKEFRDLQLKAREISNQIIKIKETYNL
ncbi:MAG: hypothetical protein WHS65_12735 [Melioribacteraceae bacterium]